MSDRTNITRRAFGLGILAVGLSGCASTYTPRPLSEQEIAAQIEAFRVRVDREIRAQRQPYRFIDGGVQAGSPGSRMFDDIYRQMPDFEAHMNNPDLQRYVTDIMRGYNQRELAFTDQHVRIQAKAELALEYMNSGHDRVRARAALELSGAFAHAYADVFGRDLQRALASGAFNATEVIEVCGRSAPDGLAWAYTTLTRYEPLLRAAAINPMDACTIGCPGGSSFQVMGHRPR